MKVELPTQQEIADSTYSGIFSAFASLSPGARAGVMLGGLATIGVASVALAVGAFTGMSLLLGMAGFMLATAGGAALGGILGHAMAPLFEGRPATVDPEFLRQTQGPSPQTIADVQKEMEHPRPAPPELATEKQMQQEEMRLRMSLLEDNERYRAARRAEREQQLANLSAANPDAAVAPASHAQRVDQSRVNPPQKTI